MKTAIFGGSFDPVHLGHVEIAKKALKELDIDKLLVMPNYLNPLKKTFAAPAELRLRWLKKVFQNEPKITISDYEIKQNRPVYSIETIKHFKPDYFIIGSDNLYTLDKWKAIDQIKNMVEFVIATRGKTDKELLKKHGIKKVIKIDIPISSTEIRNCNFKYLPKEIEKEIKEFYGQNCKN